MACMDKVLDATDSAIVLRRFERRLKRDKPQVGDFVRYPDGMYRRIAYLYEDGFQPTLENHEGSTFYYGEHHTSHSGGLDLFIPFTKITKARGFKMGKFWIFHHDQHRAHNGVDFEVATPIWILEGDVQR